MRLLICGDRNWDQPRLIAEYLDKVNQPPGRVELVIEGGQMSEEIDGRRIGADYQGKMAAKSLGIPVMEFEANWFFYAKKGMAKAAGPIRNGWMLKYGKPDLVLAFHSDLKHSKGTKNMVMQARKAGVRVKVIR